MQSAISMDSCQASSFINQGLSYDPVRVENSPSNGVNANNHHGISLSTPGDNQTYSESENFRFLVTLKAATAMVKYPDEILITYLDKGKAYTMSVLNTMTSGAQSLKYHIFICVSFENDVQRSEPSNLNQAEEEDIRPSQVQLKTSNFNEFSVI
ncbi:hypothetical protein AJ78_00471 [Emergomyces pasteurianus Ep9510]|uniref:Grh/CP2 DB domain-containing protein n=1 Tax=Emergomyces pasteurianus Ep9510 TaxID=1447872 RepID=A0A1J9PTL6_9EURO|nr:hypothetical protein AJ78_00471 [Emergomyces pasteurianus Ep9510]